VGISDQPVSINGAVDSTGLCHSARVLFEAHLPFPIAFQINDNSPPRAAIKMKDRNVAQLATKVIEARANSDDDMMSLSSKQSSIGPAHQQKRAKRKSSDASWIDER